MLRTTRMTLVLELLVAAAMCLAAVAARADAGVVLLGVSGAIGPASADYVKRGLAHAEGQGAELVVLQMDTPGGLDTSMRDIVKGILASPVPVAVFVAPSGARAASAGTYILYAAHIAAMAPATNLGAATPVAIGMPGGETKPPVPGGKEEQNEAAATKAGPDAMTRKQMHDAAAYIRGLAQMRGRNAEWAEKAVREAVSLSAEEALEKKVIDLVAADVGELLERLDGRKLVTAGGERTLATAGAMVTRQEADWRTRLLAAITEPSIAYILLLVGIYGLFFEFYNPGYVLPGVAGAICLLLGLFALQLLPVNYAGLALIVLGIAFMVAEVFVPSFGALGIGGLIAFVAGSVMLIDTELPGYGIPYSLIALVAVSSAVFTFAVLGLALKARKRPVVSGREQLVGSVGEVLEDCEGSGWARVQGENWKIRTEGRLARGQRVRVVGMEGLTLDVRPLAESGGGN